MLTLDEMRRELRKHCSATAGDDGEMYANEWLKSSGWVFECVNQSKDSLSSKLKSYGGKRPDFIIDAGNKLFILLDAKYHSTEDCKNFTLTDFEIGKYRALQGYVENEITDCNFEVVFMVFPKEKNGKKFTFVSLDEFDNGVSTTLASQQATKVNLENRNSLWFDN